MVCDKTITNQAETLAIILLKIEAVQFNTLLPRDPLIELKTAFKENSSRLVHFSGFACCDCALF